MTQKLLIGGQEYEVGVDKGEGRDVTVEEHYIRPSAEYTDGSYMQKVGGKIMVATGYYATLYPDKPSLYWHNRPPFAMYETSDWPWEMGE